MNKRNDSLFGCATENELNFIVSNRVLAINARLSYYSD